MEAKLQEIVELHEENLIKYEQEIDERSFAMAFVKNHKFEKEYEHLLTKKTAIGEIFYDYKSAIKELRELLNAWGS